MDQADEKAQRPMEKHIQTVLLGIITAVLLGSGAMLLNLSNQMAVLTTKVEMFSDSAKNYVTFDFVDQRSKVRDLQFNDLEKRVTKLENKMDKRNP